MMEEDTSKQTEVLYAQTLERLQKLVGTDKFPELAEILVRAVHDPSDERARQIAYIAYAILHKQAESLHQEFSLQAVTESVLVEVMPEFEQLFDELSKRHERSGEQKQGVVSDNSA